MKAETLKKSILQYAMQGKLVAQDPNDEPASELLKRIKAEKEQLIKDGKIKKEKSLQPITADEIPYELPQGWEWVRIGFLEEINLGFTYRPNYVSEGVYFLSDKDISNGKIDFSNAKKVSQETYDNAAYGSKPKKGDILFGRVCTMGKPQIIETDIPFCIFVSLGFFRDHTNIVNKKYICSWMESDLFEKQVNENVKGAAQRNLNTGWLKDFLIPLPPLAEQQRIVEKLEEILPLVEEYCKNEEILSEMNKKLPKPIRQSILQYAVQGKLVPQNSNDEPASELLKRIKAEKEQLLKDGKIKKEKPLPPITEDEIPYELPQGWEWVRFSEIFDVRDGTHDSPKNVSNGIPLITSKDFHNGKIDFSNAKLISKEDHDKIQQRSCVEDNDILYSMIGGNIGNMVLVKKDREFSIKNVALFKYYSKELSNPLFLKLLLSSITIDFKNKALGGAQQFISLTFIRNYVIPLPPLAEQQRIVAKVEELMQIVDKLEVKHD